MGLVGSPGEGYAVLLAPLAHSSAIAYMSRGGSTSSSPSKVETHRTRVGSPRARRDPGGKEAVHCGVTQLVPLVLADALREA